MYYRYQYLSPVGLLTIASDGENITGLWMEQQAHFAAGHSDPVDTAALPVFLAVKNWLDAYFSGEVLSCDLLPLRPAGRPFQQQVWKILTQIPYGHTLTYGQIAKMLDAPMSAQAVGGAVGRNPISIIIPCHRVLGAGGRLTGYAGGLERKIWLLRHEGILLAPEEH